MLMMLATAVPGPGADVASLFLMLATLVAAAKAGGALAVRFGQPSVLGELIAGIVVGPALLGVVDPTNQFVHVIAEFGVVILLFQIGLHTDLRSLVKVGTAAAGVASVGVILPFAFGYLAAKMLGLETLPSLVCAAAMTATSVGISARVLGDVGQLDSPEGRTVLGAAVIDDVIGLIILTVVATVAAGGDVTTASVLLTIGAAIGFLVISLIVGRSVIPHLFAMIDRIPGSGTTGPLALALALLLAAAADRGGSALIIGAFAAGLILHATPQRAVIESSTTILGHFFVPIFFASVGASVELGAMGDRDALILGGALLAIGIGTKFLAGYVPFWHPMRYALIGAAMVPRGEVGLIFARMGLDTGVLTQPVFGAIMLMVIGTTLVTPPWLGWLMKRKPMMDDR